MKATARLAATTVLGLVLSATTLTAHAQYVQRAFTMQHRTLQNLGMRPTVKYGAFLSINEQTGKAQLEDVCDEHESGGFWEIRPIGRERDYPAHVIINRGNTRHNGRYLGIDSQTGELKLDSTKDPAENKWLIRYAGLYEGYHAYYFQNLARSTGGFDMQFLAVDQKTGEVVLTKKPGPGAHWLKRNRPGLPLRMTAAD